MRIAVDIGYGYVKALSETGKRAVFPSVVAPSPAGGVLAGALGNGKGLDYRVGVRPFGRLGAEETMLIGEAALAARGAVRTWEMEATNNAYLPLLIAAGLGLVGDGEPVRLALGLPLAAYAAQRDGLRGVAEGLDLSVSLNGAPAMRARVNDVFIFPQAAGAYYSACLNVHGGLRDASLARQPVGVVDVGYRTTDYLVMARGPGGLLPREDLAGSLDMGINTAHQAVRAEAEALARRPVDLVQVERALAWAEGSLYVQGREVSLRKALDAALAELAEQVVAKIKLAWGEEMDHLAAVLVAGGGGQALFPYLRDTFPAARLVPDPLWANAEGYLAAQALASR